MSSPTAGKEQEEKKINNPTNEEDKKLEGEEEAVVVPQEEVKAPVEQGVVEEEKKEEDKTKVKITLQEQIDDIELEDPPSSPNTTTTAAIVQEEQATAPPATEDLSKLPENVHILKEAFPDIGIEVIEAILQVNNNTVENSFETLLSMSDPNYSVAPTTEEPAPPIMPPRPKSAVISDNANSGGNAAPYSYYERHNSNEGPNSVEEQLRLDEEFAKKLAMEDEMRSEQRRQRYEQQQQRKQQQQQQDNDDDSIFNLQEELPIIKEKLKEAGNAAKKKVLDFYNQIKANTRNNSNTMQNQHGESSTGATIPTTNAQYRGLPSDDGDDLLTGDISALHLSDYDVYKQTGGGLRQQQQQQQRKSGDSKRAGGGGDEGVIYVNPPLSSNDNINTTTSPLSQVQTSTSDAQLKADEDFARQLAEEEQLEARRSRHSSSDNEDSRTPQVPPRKANPPTVVIAPRSPLEFGDSDYEDIGLTAAPSSRNNNTTNKSTAATTESSVPYVIGDDDDSDSDDLVDIDEDELFNDDDFKEAEEKLTEDELVKDDQIKEEPTKEKQEASTASTASAAAASVKEEEELTKKADTITK